MRVNVGHEQIAATIPDGAYIFVVTEATEKNAASSGKPMIALRCKVSVGPFTGRLIFQNCSLSEKALPMSLRFLRVIDPELDEECRNAEQEKRQVNYENDNAPACYVGQEFVGFVVTQEGMNNMGPQNRLTKYWPMDSEEGQDALAETAGSLDEGSEESSED